MRCWRTMMVLGLLGMFAASPAAADDDGSFFGLSAGLKGGAGGNLWTEPSNLPVKGTAGRPWPLFDDIAGGYAGGVGAFAEFRVLWGYLGLEVDLLWDRSVNWTTITFNDVVETEWTVTADQLRMPILLKGNLELGAVRLSLGFGPEFVFGTGADTEFKVTDGDQYIQQSDVDQWDRLFKAKEQIDTNLCVDIGLAIQVWRLAVTIDLRYAYNLTQPTDYTDRVDWQFDLDTTPVATLERVDVIASNSMDLRILLGVAYEMEFGL